MKIIQHTSSADHKEWRLNNWNQINGSSHIFEKQNASRKHQADRDLDLSIMKNTNT